MDIQQIRYFSRVYETCNYAHAAEQLFISRQALRKSVLKLEGEIGQTLFENVDNRLVPTDAAHRFYDSSRPALKSFAELESVVAQLHLETRDYISFGQERNFTDAFTKEEVRMMVSSDMTSREINARLKIVEGDCSEICEMVLSGVVSYANIVATTVNESLFEYEIARRGHVYLAVREDDPLAAKDAVGIADLKGRAFSTQGDGSAIYNMIASRAQDQGFSLNVVSVRESLIDRLHIVEAGLSITYAYHSRGFSRIAPHVVFIPFADPAIGWMACSIAKKGMGDSFLLRYFAGKEGLFTTLDVSTD